MSNEIKNTTGLLGAQQAIVDADGNLKPPVIQELTVRPIYRRSQDIEKWRTALKAAEATIPRRVELYDLYADILLDAHLRSVMEKRILFITAAEWVALDKEGKEIEEMRDFIDSPEFELLLRSIMESRFWGYSMVEFDFRADGSVGVFNIPKKHLRPEQGLIAYEQSGNNGIDVRTGVYAETILEVGDEKDLGLLLSAAQYVIYKRGNFGDWAQFSEVFGMPIFDAVWDGYDEKQRLLLNQALNEMGSGGKITRPKGTDLQILQGGTNNPTGDLYNNFIKACNDEISKLILGQTETTESSSSSGYAQAVVHGDTENDINRSDVAMVRRTLNRRVVKIMQANGIVFDGSFALKSDATSGLTLEQQLQMEIQMIQVQQLPISDDHFYKKYGIEKPENYDELKAEMKAKAQAALQPPMSLGDPFRKAPKANGAKTISLRDLYTDCDCGCQIPQADWLELADNPSDDDFIKKVFKGELKDGQIHEGYYFNVGKKLNDAVLQGLGGSSFKASDPRNSLKAHLDANIYAFSAAKSLAKMQEYKSKLTDENGNAVSYGAFRNAVVPIDQEFDDNHLRTEYNSAIGSATMAKKWQSLAKYDKLEYRTVGDNKVRKQHKKLNGMVFSTTDTIWNTIYPPNGWNCRCTVVPAADAKPALSNNDPKVAEAQRDAKIQPYFQRNVGTSKVIFPADHPVFQKMKADGMPSLSELSATKNYNMPSIPDILDAQKDKLPTIAPQGMNEAKQWWENTATNGKISVTGRDGISVDLDDQFHKHILSNTKTENHAERIPYAYKTPEILQDADEVWANKSNDAKALQTMYIKYYQDGAYAVAVQDNNGTMQVQTMFKLYPEEYGRKRAGVLKYRK